jgi:lipopolysaccharide/colanic/teichoic acid biosynthesis glycosyltransferase
MSNTLGRAIEAHQGHGACKQPIDAAFLRPMNPPGDTAAAAPQPKPRRRRRSRRARRPALSLAAQRLADGGDVVPAEGNRSPGYVGLKRVLDVAGALGALILFSPILLFTWLVLIVTGRANPIYKQTRLGYRGRPFTIYKFRTMVPGAADMQDQVENEKDGPIFKNRRDPRITWFGQILRSTSIDELPQLLNVLKGDMSLVGPRPPIGKEVAQYEPWQRRRLSIKPGLTCLWQVSGRCEIGFVEWVRMDLWYVRNQSLSVDLRLLWQTPTSVLSRRGAY